MNKIIITKIDDRIVTAEYSENRILDINFETTGSTHVDDIFVGRVESIAKNINAAFIEIADGVKCFYQMTKTDTLKVGDELPVQIVKDAVKTKDAECTTKLSLPGKYVVVTEGKYRLGISSKIPQNDKRFELQQLFDSTFSYEDEFSFIIRTNAESVSNEEVISQAKSSINELKAIKEKAEHMPPFKKIMSGNAYYLDKIRDAHTEIEVITDISSIFEEIECTFPNVSTKLYNDELLSLTKLYKLESAIDDGLSRKVWLKSGGYLVIDETEAMTIIDVNTGKNDTHGNMEDTFFKTNIEAAIEAAAQMRFRNLSGIIIIDFIDMRKREHMDELIICLKERLMQDPIKATFVDVTKLNLVEVTRKKMYKNLREQLSAN